MEGEGSNQEVLDRIGAEDILDGSRKEWIVQKESDANYQFSGVYSITVEVENSFGDTSSESLPIHVVSASSQQVRIDLSEKIVYVSVGQELNPASYISGVRASNGERIDPAEVSVSSGVNSNVPGSAVKNKF